MRRTHRFWALVTALAVSGCSRQAMSDSDDGGMSGSDAALTPDVALMPDVALTPDSEFYPWDGSVDLFGSCTADDQCRYAAGAQCLTSYPGGLCSLRCQRGLECGPRGACVQNVCLPTCTATENCVTIGGMCAGGRYCVPSCGAGSPPCATGTACDPYSVACTTQPTTGGDNGAPCTSDDQCKGFCMSDGSIGPDGNPVSGYLGGLCVSYARAPDRSALFDGGPLPASNCPSGSVIMAPPFTGPGEMTLCFPECHADGDCRPGYACWTTDGINTYSDGFCAPIDCKDGVHNCPAPSACVQDSGTCTP